MGSALGELADLGTERDRERLTALRDRLDSARLRVLVAGEAKRGKSTLINALLGRDVLPYGVTPLTAVTTTVRYGVLTADPPVSASERDLLRRVAGLSVTTFAVLNKADHLDDAGLAEAVAFTRRVLGEAGHRETVYPMSARAALAGGDDGFAAFRTDFTAYLSTRRQVDLHASAVAQARRIAGSLLDEVALTRRAAQ